MFGTKLGRFLVGSKPGEFEEMPPEEFYEEYPPEEVPPEEMYPEEMPPEEAGKSGPACSWYLEPQS